MVARMCQTKTGGGLDRRPWRHMPSDDRRQVMTLFARGEAFGRPESAVRFDAYDEVLSAEMAAAAAGQGPNRTRHADAVAELQPFVLRQVLLDDDVFGDVPHTG